MLYLQRFALLPPGSATPEDEECEQRCQRDSGHASHHTACSACWPSDTPSLQQSAG